MSDEYLKLDRQICFRLYKASRTMTRIYQPILEKLDLTYPQYITMLVIWEEENIDFKDLAEKLDLKTGTLTPIIKRLETLGFVTRVKNSEDNRRLWVNITSKGKKLKESAGKVPEALLQKIDVGQEQYSKYISTLDEIINLLDLAENR